MRYLKTIFLLGIIPFLMGSGTREMKITEGIQPGNLAPVIQVQDSCLKTNGYVLLQCWAAYDAESRVQNVRMHNMLAQAQPEGLRLISVSMDEKECVFRGTVKADGLNAGTQFNEPAGNQSQLFKKYRLEKGFGNWLIDPQGVIVAKNISPNEVLKFMKAGKNG